jgi:hypothetical protein
MEGKQILMKIEDPEVKKKIDDFQLAMDGTSIALKELSIQKARLNRDMWEYLYKTFPQFKPEDDLTIDTSTYTIEVGSHSSFLNDILTRVCIGKEELPKKEDMN